MCRETHLHITAEEVDADDPHFQRGIRGFEVCRLASRVAGADLLFFWLCSVGAQTEFRIIPVLEPPEIPEEPQSSR